MSVALFPNIFEAILYIYIRIQIGNIAIFMIMSHMIQCT